jgi:phosphate transport system substrate-binding protein
VDDARLIMLKLTNTGTGVIEKRDFTYDEEEKLRFEFAEAKLILCAIHHTEPDDFISDEGRQKIIHLDPLDHTPIPDTAEGMRSISRTLTPLLHRYVDLDGRTLNKGNSMVLKFVTRGHVPMKVKGELKGGKVVRYKPAPPIFTVPRVLTGLAIALLLLSPLLASRSGVFSRCAFSFSPVNISGSTAFYHTVQTQAQGYRNACPISFLTSLHVESSDSAAGLTQLESGNLDIANSEISPAQAGEPYKDLVEHQVAVIVFTMIINKNVTGITSLSHDQITKIYTGQYTNWRQVGGPDLPIVLFGRPSGSGTQLAFTRFVLSKAVSAPQTTVSSTQEVISGVGSTPGAIGYTDLGSGINANQAITTIGIDGKAPTPGMVENNQYKFWAIERMYSQQKATNPLIASFITYVTNNIRTGDTFIRIDDMPSSVLATHD